MPDTNSTENDHRVIQEIRDEVREIKSILTGTNGRDGVFTRLTKLECWRDFFAASVVVLAGLSTTALGLIVPWYFHGDK